MGYFLSECCVGEGRGCVLIWTIFSSIFVQCTALEDKSKGEGRKASEVKRKPGKHNVTKA